MIQFNEYFFNGLKPRNHQVLGIEGTTFEKKTARGSSAGPFHDRVFGEIFRTRFFFCGKKFVGLLGMGL